VTVWRTVSPRVAVSVGRRSGGGGLGAVVVGDRLLGHGDDAGERLLVGDGEVGEDLAVDLDPGQLQTLDQPVVGEPVRAGRRVDPGDPQLAEVALAVAFWALTARFTRATGLYSSSMTGRCPSRPVYFSTGGEDARVSGPGAS
jgi:hypothetical protein